MTYPNLVSAKRPVSHSEDVPVLIFRGLYDCQTENAVHQKVSKLELVKKRIILKLPQKKDQNCLHPDLKRGIDFLQVLKLHIIVLVKKNCFRFFAKKMILFFVMMLIAF